MTESSHPRYYPGQFATTPDHLHVAIPHSEIVTHMVVCGEYPTLNAVCLSVAVVNDAINQARQQPQSS